jgi:hypothetical protein
VRHFPVQRMRATEKHRGRFASTARRLGKTPRPRDRHGRPDAVGPGRITGGGDDAASLPLLRIGADDKRLPAERGVAPLLHRGVERVHVEMGDDPHRTRFSEGAGTRRLSMELSSERSVASSHTEPQSVPHLHERSYHNDDCVFARSRSQLRRQAPMTHARACSVRSSQNVISIERNSPAAALSSASAFSCSPLFL